MFLDADKDPQQHAKSFKSAKEETLVLIPIWILVCFVSTLNLYITLLDCCVQKQDRSFIKTVHVTFLKDVVDRVFTNKIEVQSVIVERVFHFCVCVREVETYLLSK